MTDERDDRRWRHLLAHVEQLADGGAWAPVAAWAEGVPPGHLAEWLQSSRAAVREAAVLEIGRRAP